MTTRTTTFPKKAKVVIIGINGGAGRWIALWLARMGMRDVVGLDQGEGAATSSHTSGFIFNTVHDKFTVWSTTFSRIMYEEMGRFLRTGGFEIWRKGDEVRRLELVRKVQSGRAFGTNVRMVSAREVKIACPHINEEILGGAMYDPECGLVTPRFEAVLADVRQELEGYGGIQILPNTAVTDIEVDNGHVRGVHTEEGFIEAPIVIITAGMWSPLFGEMAGAPIPLAVGEHPLIFFPSDELAKTGKHVISPIIRDQSMMAYERGEFGFRELGIYPFDPLIMHPRDILTLKESYSPSRLPLNFERVQDQWERMAELIPFFGTAQPDLRESFGGLLSFTPDNGSLIGETPEVRGLFVGAAIWVKDIPALMKLLAECVMYGTSITHDFHSADIARFYPVLKTWEYARATAKQTGEKIYGSPPVHPLEPYDAKRNINHGPYYQLELQLGGHFRSAAGAGYERADGYTCNEYLLSDYGDRIPVRENEWDAMHMNKKGGSGGEIYRIADAELLAMSDGTREDRGVGMVNLSHFAIAMLTGPQAPDLAQYLAVREMNLKLELAKDGQKIGRVIYTHFLNRRDDPGKGDKGDCEGGVRSDLVIIKTDENEYCVVMGGADGNRDITWMRKWRDLMGFDAEITDVTHKWATIGFWGPNARTKLARFAQDPEELTSENFKDFRAKWITLEIPVSHSVVRIRVWALSLSYMGEEGWELYFENDVSTGTRLASAFLDAGVIPVGIYSYASSRRLEMCYRLQGVDMDTEYNLVEAGLALQRRDGTFILKGSDYVAREYHVEQVRHAEAEGLAAAYLCTLTMDTHAPNGGTPRYPVGGEWPILDPATKEPLVDSKGRISYNTSTAYCPSLGVQAVMAYIPGERARVEEQFLMTYFEEDYPLTLRSVGMKSLYDPRNERVRR